MSSAQRHQERTAAEPGDRTRVDHSAAKALRGRGPQLQPRDSQSVPTWRGDCRDLPCLREIGLKGESSQELLTRQTACLNQRTMLGSPISLRLGRCTHRAVGRGCRSLGARPRYLRTIVDSSGPV